MFVVSMNNIRPSSVLELLPKFSKRRTLYILLANEFPKLFVGQLVVDKNDDDIDALFEEEEEEVEVPNPKKRVAVNDLQGSIPEDIVSKNSKTHKLDDLSRQASKQIEFATKFSTTSVPKPKRTKLNPFKHEKLNARFAEMRKDHKNGAIGKIPECFHTKDSLVLSKDMVDVVEYFFDT